MREPKFRFYHTRLKKMAGPIGIGVVWELLVQAWGAFLWSEIIIDQFTGLHDKNGKEIYEGDILRGVPGCVRYEGGGFDPFAIPEWECTLKPERVEVIGNIHESPELIP